MRNLYIVLAICMPFILSAQWDNAEEYFITENSIEDQLTYQALQTDVNNNLHTCWLQARESIGYNILYDRRSPDGDWNGNATINEEDEVVREAEMQVEDAQKLHFIYTAQNVNGVDVYLVSIDGANKTVIQITDDSNTEHNPSIAMDALGNLHICWIGLNAASNYKVFYANNSTGSFVTQEMLFSEPSPTPENAQPKIEVTSEGGAHIMYTGTNNSGGPAIRYVFNEGLNFATWQNSVIIVNETMQESTARFTIDNNNKIHLVVEGSDGGSSASKVLYYGKQVSTDFVWDGPATVDAAGTLQLNSIDVTDEGDVHLGLDAKTGSQLDGTAIYATNADGDFAVSTVLDDQLTYGGQIKIDNIGKPYLIAFKSSVGNGDEEIILYGDPTTDATDPGLNIADFELLNLDFITSPSMNGFMIRGQEIGNASYHIFDLSGRIMESGSIISNELVSTALLSKGMYVVHVSLDYNTTLSATIVK